MVNHVVTARRAALRAVAVLVVAALGVLVQATSAGAHTDFIAADPHDGASLHELPRQIRLEFSEQMDPGLSVINVQGGAGISVPLEATSGEKPTELVAALPGSLAPEGGTSTRWTVTFRVVSRDGHPVAGTTTFVVRTPASATPDADPPDTTSASPTAAPTSTPTSAPATPGDGAEGQPRATNHADQMQKSDTSRWLPLSIGGGVLVMLMLATATVMRLVGRDRDT